MVDVVLAAQLRPAVRVRIVARAEHARAGQVVREQVAQLVHAVPAVHALSQCPSTGRL
jgi:hypothetical protein